MATINYWGLTGVKDSVTVNLTITIDQLITAIAADEGLATEYYTVSSLSDPSKSSLTFGDSSTTLTQLGLVDGGTVLCTTNQTGTKQDRQIQKLEIAAKARAADSNPRATYDISLMPTKYDENQIINNPNAGGLVEGRPWIETVSTFTFYEAFGTTATISTTQYVSGNKIYAESSSYDVSIPAPPARVVVNDIEVLRQGDTPNPPGRGHNLVILDSYGDVVTAATQYDTWDIGGAPGARAALAAALSAVASGRIAVLVAYDASGLDAGIRSAINTGYGSTNSNTWTSARQSHIFIGVKI
jgi:hypothetical protein